MDEDKHSEHSQQQNQRENTPEPGTNPVGSQTQIPKTIY